MIIDGTTQIYGLIGYPVKHTFSPLMHNAAFETLGINAVYVPFEVEPEDLKRTLQYMKSVGVRGLNVTIPYKEKVLKYLDKVDEEAAMIGAVNTIVNEKRKLKGYNTDGRGFVLSLKKEFGLSPKGKRFFIIGAGGASRAISYSLALNGARRIVLSDMVEAKAVKLAKSLAEDTSAEVVALPAPLKKEAEAIKELLLNSDVLVNATPCGMKITDPRIIDRGLLHNKLLVYDIIYNPRLTRLLKDARKKGARFTNGIGMLLYQGAISFNLWTGKRPPVDVMEDALDSIL